MEIVAELTLFLLTFFVLLSGGTVQSKFIGMLRTPIVRFLPCALVALVNPVDARNTEPYLCREIGREWVWFEDHAAVYVKYGIAGPAGRRYQVGTGVSVSGSPWGRRVVRSGRSEVLSIGVGALHIRRRDDGPDFIVCASGLGLGHIPLIPATQF